MPATTPVYALRYQELGDAPHGPNLGQNLATDVETQLVRIDDLAAKGACAIRQTTAQSIAHATPVTVTFDVTDADTDTMADLVNDRIVIRKAGFYLLTGLYAAAPHVDGYRRVAVAVNGTAALSMVAQDSNNEVGLATTPQVTLIRQLAVNDLITLQVLQTSGAALNTNVASPYQSVLTAARL